ncbi:hypothetical protein ACIPIN_13660 [Pseudomonas sp. NPDC087697]|uniref:hypothetical protein n=1 Tax=Pseudomonas sp. NPDC087697 TaxID=3364447 RepID=UPI0037F536CC
MTANEKLTSKLTRQQLAEQVRIKHRSFNLPNAADPHPVPVIVGLVGDGLLTKALLDQTDVVVKVEKLNEYNLDDSALLQLLDPSTSPPSIVYQGPSQDLPETAAGYPQYFPLPSLELVDNNKVRPATRYQVRLIVTQGNTGNDIPTKELDIGVDRYAPYQSKQDGSYIRPVKTAILNALSGIDDLWLEQNTHLKLKVDAEYEFYSSTDFIQVSISTTVSGADGPLPNVVYSGNVPATGVVDIPVASFASEVAKDGTIHVVYSITDVVGNASKVSFDSPIQVTLRPAPVLIAPRIPIIGGAGGTLDLKTLESKVYVYVDRPAHALSGDKILLLLNSASGVDADAIQVGELAVGTGTVPLRFELRYLNLKHLHIDPETPVPAKLSYHLKRMLEPVRVSPETLFTYDDTSAGPINPDFPSLTNPKMVNVGLKGDSGTLNHITGADRGKSVTIQTPMKEPNDPWAILASEMARLWYNGVMVYELGLTGTETELTFDIPSATIDQQGTGIKSAWWTIQGDLSANTLSSPMTLVTVDAAVVEFDPPSVPTFTITDGGVRKQVVNCKSLTLVGTDRQLTVTVPVNATYMPNQSVIVVHSVGTSDRLGFDVIEGTQFSESYTITGSEVGNTFTVNIKPYLTKVKPIQPTQESGLLNGAIKIWYVVQVDGGPVLSDTLVHEVRLLASGKYCEEV